MARFAIPKGLTYKFNVTILQDDSFLTQDISNLDLDNSEFYLISIDNETATKVATNNTKTVTLTKVADSDTAWFLRTDDKKDDASTSGELSFNSMIEAQEQADTKNNINTVDTSIVTLIEDSDNNGIISADTTDAKVIIPSTISVGTDVTIGDVTATVTEANIAYGYIVLQAISLEEGLNTLSFNIGDSTMLNIEVTRDDDWESTVKVSPYELDLHVDDLDYLGGKLAISLSSEYTDSLTPKFADAVDNYYGLPSYQAILLVKFNDDTPDKFVKINKVYVIPTGE